MFRTRRKFEIKNCQSASLCTETQTLSSPSHCYQTAPCHITLNSNIHSYCHDNFKAHIPKPSLVKRHLTRPTVTQNRLLVLQRSPCLNGGQVCMYHVAYFPYSCTKKSCNMQRLNYCNETGRATNTASELDASHYLQISTLTLSLPN
jgi:hypothetical protein